MKYDSGIIEKVASLNDIVEIISGYVSLKKAGGSFKGLCPFHSEKTPSFHVNPERQIFHCFGCGVGGDAIAFIQKIENQSFPEALEFLANRVSFELPRKNFVPSAKREETESLFAIYEHALQLFRKNFDSASGEEARTYLAKRQFSREVLEGFEVGWASDGWRGLTDSLFQAGFRESLLLKSGLVKRSPKGSCYDLFRGRVVFPIRNAQGKLIGFGGRVISPEGTPKYLNSPETDHFKKGRELFALSLAKRNISASGSKLFIVEGYLDCLKLHEAGIRNTVATLGTALTPDHVRLIRRYAEEAILVFDGDQAGSSAAFRSLDVFLEEAFPVKVVSLEGGMDPDDFIRKNGKETFVQKLEGAQDFFEYRLKFLAKRYSQRDPAGLLKIAGNLLEVIFRIPNAILQTHYLKKLATELKVDESSLRSELAKLKQKRTPRHSIGSGEKQVQATEKKETGYRKEEVLLLYLLSETEGSEWIEKIEEDFFYRAETRQAFGVLVRIRKSRPEGVCFSEFVRGCEESPLKQQIVKLSFLEWKEEERSKALRDCVRKINHSQREKDKQALSARIRTAEENGEVERLREYLKDFQKLTVKG